MSEKHDEKKGSFWATMPGCITAIGGLVSVVIAGVVALSAAGFIQPPFMPTAAPSSVSDSNSSIESVPIATNINNPPVISTAPPTSTFAQAPQNPPVSTINWIIDSTGVCRDNIGGYPRWSHYDWAFSQCEQACQDNPNCQGFAMSKERDYCQLMGSDGNNEASNPGARITRGDKAQPDYACYLKSADQTSISFWIMDSTGVCRDDTGGYPRWSAYDWTFSQCEQTCRDNPNCQGFAMSKERNYCQLMGSDGSNAASNPGTQITRGDKSQPGYVCYIKR